MNDTLPKATQRHRFQTTYWLLIAAQWILLTLALSGGMVRSSNALRDYVSPNLGDGWLTIGALLAGLLLGATVMSPKALVPLILTMCVVAATIFGLVIYFPAWQGTLFRSTTLANYAQQQALFLGVWTGVPAVIGSMVGYLLSGDIRRALELRIDGPDDEHVPWWDRPGQRAEHTDQHP